MPVLPPLRFGVLGTGRITRRLVAELQSVPEVSVTAIASRDGQRARWYASQYGVPRGVQGYQSLWDDPEIDALYIALPPSLHATTAIAAAAAGKHLLCEKPLTPSLADSLAIDAACAAAGVQWLDATAWLHHPRTEAIDQTLRSGTLGQLKHLSAAVSFFEPFQSKDHRLDASLGGGCLLDLGWYAAGAAIWAAGRAPARVFATGRRRGEVWDRVTGLLWFDAVEEDEGEPRRDEGSAGTDAPAPAAQGPLTATLDCAYDTATRKWFELAGDTAAVVCDDFTRPWPDRPARCWIHDRAGAVTKKSLEGNQEQQMIAALAAAVAGHRDLSPLRRQALRTVATLEALQASALAERPVEVAPSPAETCFGETKPCG